MRSSTTNGRAGWKQKLDPERRALLDDWTRRDLQSFLNSTSQDRNAVRVFRRHHHAKLLEEPDRLMSCRVDIIVRIEDVGLGLPVEQVREPASEFTDDGR